MSRKLKPFLAHSELTDCIYIIDGNDKYEVTEQCIKAMKATNRIANVLDKIRAEILQEKEHAYADFERYKVEYLGQCWDDALDSLPQDDFRYGMERCIEILDKYKAESEVE